MITIKDIYAWDKITIPSGDFERVCKNFCSVFKSYKRIKNNEDYKNLPSYISTLEKMKSDLCGIYTTCYWLRLDQILLNWCFEDDLIDEEFCDILGLNYYDTTHRYIDAFGNGELSAFPRTKLSQSFRCDK